MGTTKPPKRHTNKDEKIFGGVVSEKDRAKKLEKQTESGRKYKRWTDEIRKYSRDNLIKEPGDPIICDVCFEKYDNNFRYANPKTHYCMEQCAACMVIGIATDEELSCKRCGVLTLCKKCTSTHVVYCMGCYDELRTCDICNKDAFDTESCSGCNGKYCEECDMFDIENVCRDCHEVDEEEEEEEGEDVTEQVCQEPFRVHGFESIKDNIDYDGLVDDVYISSEEEEEDSSSEEED